MADWHWMAKTVKASNHSSCLHTLLLTVATSGERRGLREMKLILYSSL